jgi:hypothetical protein
MKIIANILDILNYFAHLEGQRFCETYTSYETPKYLKKFL